ncbi:hypothetical protein [Lysinibacillus sp. NPDC093688]|uniref:hypothetical protein n=1 Tax=Lysinibacillus sp. NPDC093688 TaxID=3390577 RepID=UPI003D0316BA
MEEIKIAQLDQQQLERINELEKNIGVTLVAYDSSTMPSQGGAFESNNSTLSNH